MEEFERIIENFNDLDTERTFNDEDRAKYEVFAIIAYLVPVLFFLPYVNDNNSTYCKFHSNQSLTWLVVLIVMGCAFKLVSFIPIIGPLLAYLVYPVAVLAVDAALCIGSHKGKAYKLPFIGDLIKAF